MRQARPSPTEDQIQKAVAAWLRVIRPPWMWLHIPNGGARSERTGALMKALGVRPGAPDLMIDAGHCGTFYVELKTQQGRQQPTQKDFQREVEALGSQYAICRSLRAVQGQLSTWGLLDKRGAPVLPERGAA